MVLSVKTAKTAETDNMDLFTANQVAKNPYLGSGLYGFTEMTNSGFGDSKKLRV